MPSIPTTKVNNSLASDRTFVRGIAWSGTAKWTSQVVAWAATLVIARILSPNDYGIYGLATLITEFISVFAECGLGASVLVFRDLGDEQVKQSNALSALLGLAGALIACALAYPLAVFFHTDALKRVIPFLSLEFILVGLQSVPASLLRRKLRFRDLALIDFARKISLAAATVVLALSGSHYWALVLGSLLSWVVSLSLTLWIARCGFAWPRTSELGKSLRFSLDLVVSRGIWYLYSNADFAVAGRVLGTSTLGIYTLAWNLANAPLQNINSLISGVSTAHFAAAQDDFESLRRYLLKPIEILSVILFPTMIGIALVAGDAVPLLLGLKWVQAVPVLRMLAVYASMRCIMPMFAQLLIAVGDARFAVWNGIVSVIVFAVAFYLGSYWGAVGIATAWVLVYPVNAIPFYVRAKRLIKFSDADFFSALAPALVGSAALALCVLTASHFLSPDMPLAFRVVSKIGVGLAVYSAVLLLIFPNRVRRFKRVFQMLRHDRSKVEM